MTFREQWKAYEAAIVPEHAGPVQRSDAQDAFYAGALSLMALLNDPNSSNESLDTVFSELYEAVQNKAQELLMQMEGRRT